MTPCFLADCRLTRSGRRDSSTDLAKASGRHWQCGRDMRDAKIGGPLFPVDIIDRFAANG